jgi:hypothetical protein
LRTIKDLNIIQISLTIPQGTICFYHKASKDLSSPGFNVFTNNLNVSREKDNFTTNV